MRARTQITHSNLHFRTFHVIVIKTKLPMSCQPISTTSCTDLKIPFFAISKAGLFKSSPAGVNLVVCVSCPGGLVSESFGLRNGRALNTLVARDPRTVVDGRPSRWNQESRWSCGISWQGLRRRTLTWTALVVEVQWGMLSYRKFWNILDCGIVVVVSSRGSSFRLEEAWCHGKLRGVPSRWLTRMGPVK